MKKQKDTNPNTLERMNEHYSKFHPENERYNDWMMPSLKHIMQTTGKILEVGCGFGKTLNEISSLTDAHLFGIELSSVAVLKAAKYYPEIAFKVEDCEQMTYQNMFDMVICSQTLEHVDNPKACILKMKEAVKPGGWLYLTVPWPGSNLDRGVKLHYWTFYAKDFEDLLPNCKVQQPDKSHMVVTYLKPTN